MERTSRTEWTHERVLVDLERLALRIVDRRTFFDEAAARLALAIPHGGACWQTLDPGSSLITAHHLQNIPDRFPALAENEYRAVDANRFADLARAPVKAATLHAATGGRPETSPRFGFLSRGGWAHELRSAFVADGAPWGALILVRHAGAGAFSDEDVVLLDRASELLARAVRRGLVREASAGAVAAGAPGVVELAEDGSPLSVSPSAEPLLAELSGDTPEAGLRTPALQAIAARTRAAGDRPASETPMARVKAPGGTWLVLHGGHLGRPDGTTAVFLQRAHPTLISPLLLAAYDLTAREREIAQLVLHGATTAQVAQRLAISPHTVGQHLKAIYAKTGSRTRGELSATLFFGEHLHRVVADVGVGDDASFLDAPRPRGVQ